jgi:hypothetical protein
MEGSLAHLQTPIGLTASRIVIIGNYMLRRPKHSKIEVVAPKEEEYLQTPATCPFSEPNQSIPRPHISLLADAFQYYPAV